VDPPERPPLVSYLSDRDWRCRADNVLYELETAFREEGMGLPAPVYDEEGDRYRDGRFAFSREWADWPLLRKLGRMMEELLPTPTLRGGGGAERARVLLTLT
jgi:hypothetical protein